MIHALDSRLCANVVEYARDVSLLVHEAYGLENDAARALAFGHFTAAAAGRIACDSGVQHLILTHILASHFVDPKKLAAEAASVFGAPVEVASDLATIDF